MSRSTRMASCAFFIFVLVVVSTVASSSIEEEIVVNVNVKRPVAVVSDKFLSFTLDPVDFSKVDALNNIERSTKIARAFSPAYLRIAGPSSNSDTGHQEFSDTQWANIKKWAERAGLEVIASLAPRISNEEHPLDHKNIINLFNGRLDHHNVSWELGYECQIRCKASGAELGREVKNLGDVLPKGLAVVGPDIVAYGMREQQQYLQDYLDAAGSALAAVTWHPDFAGISVEGRNISMYEDNLGLEKDSLYKAVGHKIAKKPLWLAESKPENFKQQFLGALVWTRRLGNSAKLGAQVLMRQPAASNIFNPTPDYWVTMLHKKLVGRQVLDAKIVTGNRTHVSFYAHCTKPSSSSSSRYERGSLTIFGINLTPKKVTASIKNLKSQVVHKYILLPGFDKDDRMFATTTLLNDEELTLVEGKSRLRPKIYEADKNGVELELPSGGIGFWVLPDLGIKVCMDRDKQETIGKSSQSKTESKKKSSHESSNHNSLSDRSRETLKRSLKQNEDDERNDLRETREFRDKGESVKEARKLKRKERMMRKQAGLAEKKEKKENIDKSSDKEENLTEQKLKKAAIAKSQKDNENNDALLDNVTKNEKSKIVGLLTGIVDKLRTSVKLLSEVNDTKKNKLRQRREFDHNRNIVKRQEQQKHLTDEKQKKDVKSEDQEPTNDSQQSQRGRNEKTKNDNLTRVVNEGEFSNLSAQSRILEKVSDDNTNVQPTVDSQIEEEQQTGVVDVIDKNNDGNGNDDDDDVVDDYNDEDDSDSDSTYDEIIMEEPTPEAKNFSVKDKFNEQRAKDSEAILGAVHQSIRDQLQITSNNPAVKRRKRNVNDLETIFREEMMSQDDNNLKDCQCRVIRGFRDCKICSQRKKEQHNPRTIFVPAPMLRYPIMNAYNFRQRVRRDARDSITASDTTTQKNRKLDENFTSLCEVIEDTTTETTTAESTEDEILVTGNPTMFSDESLVIEENAANATTNIKLNIENDSKEITGHRLPRTVSSTPKEVPIKKLGKTPVRMKKSTSPKNKKFPAKNDETEDNTSTTGSKDKAKPKKEKLGLKDLTTLEKVIKPKNRIASELIRFKGAQAIKQIEKKTFENLPRLLKKELENILQQIEKILSQLLKVKSIPIFSKIRKRDLASNNENANMNETIEKAFHSTGFESKKNESDVPMVELLRIFDIIEKTIQLKLHESEMEADKIQNSDEESKNKKNPIDIHVVDKTYNNIKRSPYPNADSIGALGRYNYRDSQSRRRPIDEVVQYRQSQSPFVVYDENGIARNVFDKTEDQQKSNPSIEHRILSQQNQVQPKQLTEESMDKVVTPSYINERRSMIKIFRIDPTFYGNSKPDGNLRQLILPPARQLSPIIYPIDDYGLSDDRYKKNVHENRPLNEPLSFSLNLGTSKVEEIKDEVEASPKTFSRKKRMVEEISTNKKSLINKTIKKVSKHYDEKNRKFPKSPKYIVTFDSSDKRNSAKIEALVEKYLPKHKKRSINNSMGNRQYSNNPNVYLPEDIETDQILKNILGENDKSSENYETRRKAYEKAERNLRKYFVLPEIPTSEQPNITVVTTTQTSIETIVVETIPKIETVITDKLKKSQNLTFSIRDFIETFDEPLEETTMMSQNNETLKMESENDKDENGVIDGVVKFFNVLSAMASFFFS